jgi:RNA polymerase sigma factor (sigma-70 family)
MEQMTGGDQEVIDRVARGSSAAFDELYRRHCDTVGRYAWGLASSRDAAQELVQDTFVTLWRSAASVSLTGDSAVPWLLVTCRNHSLNAGRAHVRYMRLLQTIRRRHMVLPEFDDPSTTLRWIQDAIDRLPEHEALVVHLCLVEGRSYKQAGAELQVSESAVAKRLERARSKLRKDLANEDA